MKRKMILCAIVAFLTSCSTTAQNVSNVPETETSAVSENSVVTDAAIAETTTIVPTEKLTVQKTLQQRQLPRRRKSLSKSQ